MKKKSLVIKKTALASKRNSIHSHRVDLSKPALVRVSMGWASGDKRENSFWAVGSTVPAPRA
jgi:hypothetical protein